MTRYLGVDWGEKRIGLALGDSETGIATPYKVVKNIADIIKVIKEEDVNQIIVGKPLSISNSKFQISNEFNDFIKLLENSASIPVKLFDERLSSQAADKLTGDRKTKAGRDELAAMIILQGYLDFKKIV
jgi:putative Holliday junction resolvase